MGRVESESELIEASFFVPLGRVGGGEDREDGSGVTESRVGTSGRTVGGACEEGGGVISDRMPDEPATIMDVEGDVERGMSAFAGRSMS